MAVQHFRTFWGNIRIKRPTSGWRMDKFLGIWRRQVMFTRLNRHEWLQKGNI